MIYCPKCGTANRDGSKFCNDCGQTLRSAQEVRCPMCGTSNPPASVFCSECGARLTGVDAGDTGPLGKPPEPPAAEDKGAADLPDWLLQASGAVVPPSPPKPSAPLPPAAPLAEPVTPVFKVAPGEEPSVPTDWLSQLRSAALTQPEPELEPEPAPEESLPIAPAPGEASDWLARLRSSLGTPTVEAPARPEAQAAPAMETPTSPDVSATSTVKQPPLATPEQPAPAEDLPPWLAEVLGGESLEPGTAWMGAASTAAPSAETGLLEATEAEHEAPASAPAGQTEGWLWDQETLPAPESAGIPDWLREIGPPPAKEPFSSEEANGRSAAFADAERRADLPDWLAKPSAAQPAVLANETEELGDGLARADIPDWLAAMRPASGEPEDAPAEAAEDGDDGGEHGSAGVLDGLRGIIPIELSALTAPEASVAPIGSLLGTVPESSAGAETFARLINTVAPPPAAPAKRSRGAYWGRLLTALILILAACVPMITGIQIFTGGLRQIPLELQQTQAAIDGLAPGAAVLVAYDFDPSAAGEMEPIAEALTAHLMARQARILAVSLAPAGPATAQGVLDHLAAEQPAGYAYGTQFVNLGYLAGREAGLRSLIGENLTSERTDFVNGAALGELPAFQGIQGLDDLALIVVIGSDQQTARWWIEQVGSQSGIPLVMGVSAAAEAYLQPYTAGSPAQVSGLVAGLSGAADYNQVTTGGSRYLAQMEALAWVVAAAFLLLLFNVILSPLFNRERGQKVP